MSFVLNNRVWETTTTTGTTDIALDGAKDSNFDTFTAGIGVGNTTHYFIIWASGYEYGVGTIASGPTLQRTTVVGNHLHTTAKVSLPDGEKDVICALLASSAGLLDQEQQRTAALNLNGYALKLDADDSAHLIGDVASQAAIFLGGVEMWRVSGDSVALTRHTSGLAGATGCHQLELYRSIGLSSGYRAGEILFSGEDNGNNYNNFAKIIGYCVDPSDTSEDGRVGVKVQVSGTLVDVINFDGDAVWIRGNGTGYGGLGLISTDQTNPKTAFLQYDKLGFETYIDGRTGITTSGQTPLVINRATNDGQLVSLRQDNSEEGSISVSGTTVTYGTFTGVHWSEWDSFETAPDEQLGTVVVATEELYQERKEHLPRVEVGRKPADPSVYGVIVSRELVKGGSRLLVASLGTFRVRCVGAVARGDLLELSDVPGVARRQADTVIRSSTIGKATHSDDSPDIRLVNATLCCG